MSSCDLTKNLENVIDFDALINIIVNGHYKVVTLQFSDDYLCICSDIFTILRSKMDSLCSIESKAMDIVEFYVTADSTFGSAIDDISAMHVSSDLILFFGTDLSSSGTIPTVIVPVIRDVDVCQCSTLICASICASLSDEIEYSNIILLSSLPYYHSLPKISSSVAGLLVEKNQSRNVAVGKLPNEASVSNWLNLNRNSSNGSIPGNSCESTSKEISSPTNTSIGGFIVESFMTEETNPNKNCFVYIGAENEQFHSILLSVGDKHDVLFVDAVDYSKRMYCSGCPQSALAIRKRYGGILKVKDASVIGLLVGSMGVSQKKIVKCIDRMKILIKTAHKKSYVFVMGRVTETKLCNFPEVDVFVLISNDDSCYVPPKTYPVPVITPFELEIGLSAREWNSHLETLSDGMEASPSELEGMIEKVSLAFPAQETSDSDSEDIEINALDDASEVEASRELIKIRKAEEQALIAFQSSAAIDFFKKRDFQGLDPGIHAAESQLEGNADIMKVHEGRVGVASGYSSMGSNASDK